MGKGHLVNHWVAGNRIASEYLFYQAIACDLKEMTWDRITRDYKKGFGRSGDHLGIRKDHLVLERIIGLARNRVP